MAFLAGKKYWRLKDVLLSKSLGKIETKSFGGNIFLSFLEFVTKSFDGKKFTFKSPRAKSNFFFFDYKSFGGKIVLRKKGCTFDWCLVLSQKYTKSVGGKNLALCNNRFVPSKVKVFI